ncbi:murein hydrolase activator EnvC family protein [Arcobacter sp. FWKO B]|uniref:murein hydrolase activator EnvC family protein n=1 Tax=Arcobacter sp. FWKO B TaxID=2593672 RepID=UPI0018A649A0|nr:peptidoglycan DD-metalloendopeptidase family protein [Arcobacter sp. FWKO B]QOG11167.1 peptidoglycan DD-metalloendopeptidase family protein [Arcobacter sp. FWKO B]
MIRYLFVSLSFLILSHASVKELDQKIVQSQSVLQKQQSIESETNIKIQLLAKEIVTQRVELDRVTRDVTKLEELIANDQKKLEIAKEEIKLLKKSAQTLLQDKKNQEEAIVSTIINEFAISLGIQYSSEKTLDELIDKEIYSLLLENSLEEIKKLDVRYLQITQNEADNQQQINKLQSFIEQNEKKKKDLSVLVQKQERNMASLEAKHKEYQAQLKNIIDKQNELTSLLQNLNILKREESKKEQERIAAAKKAEEERQRRVAQSQQQRASTSPTTPPPSSANLENVDIQVRQLGSSVKGVQTTKYRGVKTISPLSSYKIVKNFGKYHDPIYKIELFNDSISMVPNTVDTKVYSVLLGKVVYIKKSPNSTDNTVIIEHANGLHTVYSNLEQISPTIEQNKPVKQGYAIGRVRDSLVFQAIINSAFVNPVELFGK